MSNIELDENSDGIPGTKIISSAQDPALTSVPVLNFENEEVETLELNSQIFDIEPSSSILNQVVNWQRSRSQSGTHLTKGISQVSGTTKKPHKQKGTGKARLGSLRAAQCRGGGIIFGPLNRSHEFKLSKKFRKLGLRMALSSKYRSGKIKFINNLDFPSISTKALSKKLESFYKSSLLVIDCVDAGSNLNFKKSVGNIKNIKMLLHAGTNVYDLLKHESILITKGAVNALEERLK